MRKLEVLDPTLIRDFLFIIWQPFGPKVHLLVFISRGKQAEGQHPLCAPLTIQISTAATSRIDAQKAAAAQCGKSSQLWSRRVTIGPIQAEFFALIYEFLDPILL